MNILFDINHPADVHFFRHTIQKLKDKGHSIVITSRDKDVAIQLLNAYQLPHICLSKAQTGLFSLALELLAREFRLISILRKNKIGVCASFTGAAASHTAKILGIPSLVFYDNEGAKLQNKITYPFATKIYTPACYKDNLGKNHIKFNAIKESAYLSPKYFKPDPNIHSQLGVAEGQKLVIIRTVAWRAAHDIGHCGLSKETIRGLIDQLAPKAKLHIVSEDKIDDEFADYHLHINPEHIHDALSVANLFISEGATMVCESACLGTPAIYVNPQKPSHVEYVEKYGLVFDLKDRNDIINKADEIISTTTHDHWTSLQAKLISESIDVPEWMAEEILKYDKAHE